MKLQKRRAGAVALIAVVVVAAAVLMWIVRSAASNDNVAAGDSADSPVSHSGVLADGSVSPAVVGTGDVGSTGSAVTVPPLPSTSGVTPSTPEVDPSSGVGQGDVDPSSGVGQGDVDPSDTAGLSGDGDSSSGSAASARSLAGSVLASSSPTLSTRPPAAAKKAEPRVASTTTQALPGTTTSRSSYPDTISPAAASATQTAAAVRSAVAQAAREGITQSVVVLDRKTGKTVVSVNGGVEMPAVSIAKLLFAADWMDNAGGGAALPADERADMQNMISTSDDDIASDYYGYHGEGDLVTRVAKEYGLTGTEPASNPRYWGGIKITADDIASLLQQMLDDPKDGPYLSAAMRDATRYGADGYNQEFGMNAVSGAGSKQGWGCCLGGVVAIHSAGFTANEIVVVLSTSTPDASGINLPEVSAFENDPGFVAAVAASTRTAKAAVDPSG